jgi:hypothetical protein
MTVAIREGAQTGFLVVRIVGTAVIAECLGSVLNPEGVDLQIVEAWLHLVEGAHAGATGNIGLAATGVDAEELTHDFPWNGGDDTMWTIIARGAAEAAATAAQNGTFWPAAEYLTVTNAVAVSTGLIADLYLKYIRLEPEVSE